MCFSAYFVLVLQVIVFLWSFSTEICASIGQGNVWLTGKVRGKVREFCFGRPVGTLGFACWLRYCTNVAQWTSTKLCTMLGSLLGWYTIYIFRGCCPLREFCQVRNSLCVQVLHFPILAALLHGTRAVGVSQTLRHGTRNAIKELFYRASPIFGMAAITLGIGPYSSIV